MTPVLTVVETLSTAQAPGRPNEDAVGHLKRSAWVVDGATGLGETRYLPGPSDAAWLVQVCDRFLSCAADRPDYGPRRLISEMLEHLKERLETEIREPPEQAFAQPSAGLVLVRLRKGRLEWARLGDCKAIFLTEDGNVRSTPKPSLARLDARVLRRMTKLLEAGIDPAEARRSVLADLRDNRGLLNRPSGYWAVAADPAAARHAAFGNFDLGETGAITALLVTDGFYRLVDTFKIVDSDGDLIRASQRLGLAEMTRRLRVAEAADPACRDYPRFKPHDDSTAALIRIVP